MSRPTINKTDQIRALVRAGEPRLRIACALNVDVRLVDKIARKIRQAKTFPPVEVRAQRQIDTNAVMTALRSV